MKSLSDTEWAYLAGFFDGEGCVSGFKRGYPRITITQKDPRPLMWIQSLCGGTLDQAQRSGCFGGGVYRWRLFAGKSVALFIEGVLPYTIVKRDDLRKALEWL